MRLRLSFEMTDDFIPATVVHYKSEKMTEKLSDK